MLSPGYVYRSHQFRPDVIQPRNSSNSEHLSPEIFDAMPGDIFVLRNAGNTCTHAEGLVGDFWTAGLRLWFRVLGSGFRVLGLGGSDVLV